MQKSSDESSLYRRVAADALRVSWAHKHLWIFGFFAAMIGYGGVSEVFFAAYDRSANILPAALLGKSSLYLIPGMSTINAVVAASPYPALSVLIFLGVIAIFAAFFAWIITVSIGALIGSVKKIEQGGDADFAAGIKMGTSSFWRLLGLLASQKALVAALFLLTEATVLPLIKDRSNVSWTFFVATFIAFTVIAIAASLVILYAANFVIIKRLGFTEALAKAWRLFAAHWLISLEMILALFFATIIIGLAAMLAVLILSVPIIFLIFIAALAKAGGLVTLLMTVIAVIVFAALIAVASFLAVFQSAAWTLLWTRLTEGKPISKLLRLSARLKEARR